MKFRALYDQVTAKAVPSRGPQKIARNHRCHFGMVKLGSNFTVNLSSLNRPDRILTGLTLDCCPMQQNSPHSVDLNSLRRYLRYRRAL